MNKPICLKCEERLRAILKITLLSLLLIQSASFVWADNSLGQVKISIERKSAKIKAVLKDIEKQCDLRFFYNPQRVDVTRKVTVDFHYEPLEEVLDKIFEGTTTRYELRGRQVLLFSEQKGDEESVAATQNTSPDKVVPVAQKEVSGVVTDEKTGDPLPGVNVVATGTIIGTVTDVDGRFKLDIPVDVTTLTFSFIGFQTQTVSISNQTNLNINLVAEITKLEEIVVVAFGAKQKALLIESVDKVDDKFIKNRPVNNVLSALQGQVAGVNITQNSGQPGTAPTITIRGVGSLQSGTSPLIIIDGVPGTISLIDPNDVESISVLKDAAASSIYGARAANGVVIVTTKKAKSGKLSVSYAGYIGFQKPTELFQEANAYDYANAFNKATMYDLITASNTEFDPVRKVFTEAELEGWKNGTVPSTDWRKALFSANSGVTKSHYLSVSGGLNTGKATVRNSLSFGYLQQDGNVANTSYKRYTLRSNNEVKWSKFSAGLSLSLVTDSRSAPSSKTVGNLGQIINAINRQRPVDPIKLADGQWNITSTNDTRNPVRQAEEGGYKKEDLYNVFLNCNLSYVIADGVKLHYTTGLNYIFSRSDQFQNQLAWYNKTITGPNSSTKANYLDAHNLQQFNISYDKTFKEKHHLNLLSGVQSEYHPYDSGTMSRRNYVNNSSNSMQLGDPSTQTNGSGSYNWALIGFFGRANYDYDERYLLEFNCRQDGSSRLSAGRRWGFFSSLATGWRLSEEKFWDGLKKVLPEFKIRASYGTLGNSNLPGSDYNTLYYQDKPIVGPDSDLKSVFDGTIFSALTVIQAPNTEFTWEKTAISEVALDGAILSPHLTYTLAYFDKTTKGMLMTRQVSGVNGSANYVTNIGKMQNTGVELSLNYSNTTSKEVNYNFSFNYTHIENKILDIGGQNLPPVGNNKNFVGYPINAYLLYAANGYMTKQEYTSGISSDPILPGQKWGDQKIRDMDDDGRITTNDRVLINKSSVPKNLFGFNFDVSYKGFGIGGMVQGATDFYKYLGASVGYGFNSGYSITKWTIDNSYDPFVDEGNYNTRLPRVSVSNGVNNTYPSNAYLFNSSYARLKNLQLYYDFRPGIIQRMHIQNLRVYVSGQNLYTLTSLPKALGIDPEIRSATAGYPVVKIFTFGLNLSL